jgi:hypothetical protein
VNSKRNNNQKFLPPFGGKGKKCTVVKLWTNSTSAPDEFIGNFFANKLKVVQTYETIFKAIQAPIVISH